MIWVIYVFKRRFTSLKCIITVLFQDICNGSLQACIIVFVVAYIEGGCFYVYTLVVSEQLVEQADYKGENKHSSGSLGHAKGGHNYNL